MEVMLTHHYKIFGFPEIIIPLLKCSLFIARAGVRLGPSTVALRELGLRGPRQTGGISASVLGVPSCVLW